MKRLFTPLFVFFSVLANAQFINQLTYLNTFTKSQVDSILYSVIGDTSILPNTHGVKTYRVIYNTVKWDSTPCTASGLLCIPTDVQCEVPIISYQHGTTPQRNSVPSYETGEWFLGLGAASLGTVAVLPDYLGLGYSNIPLHPYQHAQTEATCVVDMIRAAKEVVDSLGAPVDDQLFLMGYSQGGHATMAAHQLIQQKLDSVMHVTASAPMSGAYDMSGVMVNLMLSQQSYPEPYYLPFILLGYNEVYHLFAQDSDIMVHPYDHTLPPLFDGNHSGGQIDADMPDTPIKIMQPVQVDSFANDSTNFFREVLKLNDTYNWVPNSPVRMYYCQGDHYVPFQNAIVAYQHFIQNGATMIDTMDMSFTDDHVACANLAIVSAVYWFNSLIYQPLSPLGDTVTSCSSVSSPNGTAKEVPTQGNPPYKYTWSNGDTTQTATGLSPGTYYVTVMDRSRCMYIDSAVITYNVPSAIQQQVLMQVKVYPNPAKNVVNIQNLNPADNLTTIQVYDMNGGVIPVRIDRQANNIQLFFDKIASGIYYVSLKSESGKEAHNKITILN